MNVPRRSARALAVGVAVFAAAALTCTSVSAEFSGWREPAALGRLAPAQAAVQTASAPLATRRTETTIATGDVNLAAIITAPIAPDVGVVIVPGAGAADRFGLLQLAQQLAESGVAVLTYDKRVPGYSVLHRDFAQLADDAAAAAAVLRASSGVQRVGVLGMSEGGWVASAVAGRASAPVDFVLLLSTPVVTPLEQSSWIVDSQLQHTPVPFRRLVATVLAQGRAVVDYLDFDSRPYWNRTDVPVLAIWGADDALVPVNAAYRRLREALHSPLTAHVIPGAGHQLELVGHAWVTRAASWMQAPTGESITGGEPAHQSGVATAPVAHPLADPRLHVAASMTIALAGVAIFLLTRDRREKKR